ncbi:MAG: hypothetical protein QF464_21960, partial [Myxococcota bacterium]|nr:hypothetical protein [Myxococcota bacterium]
MGDPRTLGSLSLALLMACGARPDPEVTSADAAPDAVAPSDTAPSPDTILDTLEGHDASSDAGPASDAVSEDVAVLPRLDSHGPGDAADAVDGTVDTLGDVIGDATVDAIADTIAEPDAPPASECQTSADCLVEDCWDAACIDGLCSYTANEEVCDDLNACTNPDMCQGGACLSGPNLCTESCDNGIDDDLDGLSDCADEDCLVTPGCWSTCHGQEVLTCGQ